MRPMLKFLGWTFGSQGNQAQSSCPEDTCFFFYCNQDQKTNRSMDDDEIRRRLLKIVDLVNEAKKQGRY